MYLSKNEVSDLTKKAFLSKLEVSDLTKKAFLSKSEVSDLTKKMFPVNFKGMEVGICGTWLVSGHQKRRLFAFWADRYL